MHGRGETGAGVRETAGGNTACAAGMGVERTILSAHLVHDAVTAHAATDWVGRLDLIVGAAVAANVSRAPAQAQHQVQRALLLDVVVGQRAAVLQLLAREDQARSAGRAGCPPCPGSRL